MMHATVRSERGALHFIGEVNPYNVEVLRQYVRETSREENEVRLHVKVDAEDQQAFAEHARRWLTRLDRNGVAVELESVRPASRSPRLEDGRVEDRRLGGYAVSG